MPNWTRVSIAKARPETPTESPAMLSMMLFVTPKVGATSEPATMPSGPSSDHSPSAVTVELLPLIAVLTMNFHAVT